MITYYYRAPAADVRKDLSGRDYVLGNVRLYATSNRQCHIRSCSAERMFYVAFILNDEAWGVVGRISSEVANTADLPHSVICTKEDREGFYKGILRETLVNRYVT